MYQAMYRLCNPARTTSLCNQARTTSKVAPMYSNALNQCSMLNSSPATIAGEAMSSHAAVPRTLLYSQMTCFQTQRAQHRRLRQPLRPRHLELLTETRVAASSVELRAHWRQASVLLYKAHQDFCKLRLVKRALCFSSALRKILRDDLKNSAACSICGPPLMAGAHDLCMLCAMSLRAPVPTNTSLSDVQA